MEDYNSNLKPLQLFVRLLDGKTATLSFPTPHVYGREIKQRICELTRIPSHLQRLISGGFQLKEGSVISDDNVTVHLVLSLLGGKGGFGSLLRGAATKAGQKKTNNFDACRDMSGRRLRHVNAEKKLEEWKAEEEERRLEKMAEDFLKKAAKKGKKGLGDGEAEKYVAKYRKESAECVAKVEESVREACGNGKRKAAVPTAEAKRLKIWMGKRTLESDDEDSSDDDEEEEHEKSVVLNNGNQSDLSKDTEGSSDSVTGGKQEGQSSGGVSCQSGSEEEKEVMAQQRLESGGCPSEEGVTAEKNGVVEPIVHGENVSLITNGYVEPALVSATETVQPENQESPSALACEKADEVSGQPASISGSEVKEGSETRSTDAEASDVSNAKSGGHEEAVIIDAEESDRPLSFDDFNSAVELEVLGMERLKSELQARGLKCGGTLRERAARLFLLKSTPVEKLPKKLLAKK